MRAFCSTRSATLSGRRIGRPIWCWPLGYDPVEFNFESWMPAVPLINLDTVPADIDRAAYPDVIDVVGGVAESLSALVDLAPRDFTWDLGAVAERRAGDFRATCAGPGSFGPKAAIAVLREVLPSGWHHDL